jgi:D-lactate dehydrogenase
MKVLVFSARPYDQSALTQSAEGRELIFTDKRLGKETAHLAKGYEAVALFTSDDASAPIIDLLHDNGVRFILLRSVGYDHVDLKRAAHHGMRVANVPEYSPHSVAEHALAMLMALNRKLIQGQWLMQLQDFRIDSLLGFDIHGKTVGVVGTGKIGMAFVRAMHGLGARVLAYDPQINPEAKKIGVRYEPLETLLKESDIISLHCPLTPATRYLISEPQFRMMKPNAILLNTSRGAVINTKDLIIALESGLVGGAGLDVYEFEKGLFFDDHTRDVLHDAQFTRLRSFKNVLITGHQGFLTVDAVSEIARTTIGNLICFEKQMTCANELTT